MNKGLIAGLLLVLLIAAGGYFAYRSYSTRSADMSQDSTETPMPTASLDESTTSAQIDSQTLVVEVTTTGFIPATIKIKSGDTLTFKNIDQIVHTVDSDLHPTHQVYPRLNLGNIPPGQEKSLSFPDKGTFRFHDHLNPSLTGLVVVE